jgi:hypothetical protein
MAFTYKIFARAMSENVSTIEQSAAVAPSPIGAPQPDLPGALQYLKDHPHAVITHVARDFHVHRRTLTNHWTGRNKGGRQQNGGQNRILNANQVQAVFLYIENQAHAGFFLTIEILPRLLLPRRSDQDPCSLDWRRYQPMWQ